MSSPLPHQDVSEETNRVAFRFCQECSNMLYPVENVSDKILMFTCRSCKWTEEAPVSCIFRHELISSVGDTAGITQFVAEDPTLPRVQRECPLCNDLEAVFFQSQQRTSDTGMRLYYVCCRCNHVYN